MEFPALVFRCQQIADSDRERQHVAIPISWIRRVLLRVKHCRRKDRISEMLPAFYCFQMLQVDSRIRTKPVVNFMGACLEQAEITRRQLGGGQSCRNGK